MSGGGASSGPQSPAATGGPSQGAGAAPVNTPQQDFQKGFNDVTKAAGNTSAPLTQTPLGPSTPAAATPAPAVYQPPDPSSATSPAAAVNHSSGPVAPSAPPAAPAAPPATGAPPMPLAPPSTPSPAAPVAPTAGPVGPGVAPASTSQAAAGAAAAPVPISAARAERDAIAAAATAGALRRKGNNPRQVARHIAAALNVGITDPSLFWITAVTGDGQILAANNYGLAYIPDNVFLPPQVKMVTADESIPAQTRGTWATYPLLAVQEWTRHHNATLQAVIGTEENLKGFDLGAARDILTPEDMPDNGKMQGRNRLEVIAPDVAAKLAAVTAAGLAELLPPAPADNTPPAGNRINLLLEVCKPLLSANPDRAGAHLKAMVAYADYLQAVALHKAHTALDPELQRAAITDWIYWQHVSVLTSDALSAMVS
ncbi:secretion protein EccK [Mycolicibacterium bacteremicum]|nr:secretion protein EccK [Mycolicibacterium bacteremicum]